MNCGTALYVSGYTKERITLNHLHDEDPSTNVVRVIVDPLARLCHVLKPYILDVSDEDEIWKAGDTHPDEPNAIKH